MAQSEFKPGSIVAVQGGRFTASHERGTDEVECEVLHTALSGQVYVNPIGKHKALSPMYVWPSDINRVVKAA